MLSCERHRRGAMFCFGIREAALSRAVVLRNRMGKGRGVCACGSRGPGQLGIFTGKGDLTQIGCLHPLQAVQSVVLSRHHR